MLLPKSQNKNISSYSFFNNNNKKFVKSYKFKLNLKNLRILKNIQYKLNE